MLVAAASAESTQVRTTYMGYREMSKFSWGVSCVRRLSPRGAGTSVWRFRRARRSAAVGRPERERLWTMYSKSPRYLSLSPPLSLSLSLSLSLNHQKYLLLHWETYRLNFIVYCMFDAKYLGGSRTGAPDARPPPSPCFLKFEPHNKHIL